MENNKKSDILTVLENIEQMLQCYTKTVNSIAGDLQLVAIAVEAKSLATKLSLAAERWKYKLPFKEACNVDFNSWHSKMEQWLSKFADARIDISNDVVLREEARWLKSLEAYCEKIQKKSDVFKQYVLPDTFTGFKPQKHKANLDGGLVVLGNESGKEAVDELIGSISIECRKLFDSVDAAAVNEAKEKLKERIVSFFSLMGKKGEVAECCVRIALEHLTKALHECSEAFFCPEEAAYRRLYDRLSEAYFNKYIEDAKTSFQGWLSKTPKKRRLKMLKEKLEKEKARFFCGKWKEALEDYFDIGNELDGTDAGMFIFKYRRELTLEEVGQIVGQYHKMACILEEISRLENNVEAKPAANNAETQQETKTMELAPIFASWIRESAKATNMIVETIRELALTTSIRDRKLSGGKTWGHVKEALCLLGFIDNECMGTEFGRAIEEICPDKKHANVEQVLKRYNSRKKTISDGNIITEIKKMFEEVKSVNVNC